MSCLLRCMYHVLLFFFFQAEDGIRDYKVTGVQTCALPIAQAVAHSSAAPLLSRATRRCGGSDRAAAMPARPAPMMSTSVQGCVMALSSGGTEMLEERCIARKVAAGAHGLAVAGRESQHAFDGAARGLGDGGVHLDGAQALLQGQLHALQAVRSEERRVGKECRSRWAPDH